MESSSPLMQIFDMALLHCSSPYSISVRINSKLEEEVWDLTGVYGPQPEIEKNELPIGASKNPKCDASGMGDPGRLQYDKESKGEK